MAGRRNNGNGSGTSSPRENGQNGLADRDFQVALHVGGLLMMVITWVATMVFQCVIVIESHSTSGDPQQYPSFVILGTWCFLASAETMFLFISGVVGTLGNAPGLTTIRVFACVILVLFVSCYMVGLEVVMSEKARDKVWFHTQIPYWGFLGSVPVVGFCRATSYLNTVRQPEKTEKNTV